MIVRLGSRTVILPMVCTVVKFPAERISLISVCGPSPTTVLSSKAIRPSVCRKGDHSSKSFFTAW